MTPEQAAAMTPGLWLAGTLGRYRRDQAVIRWATQPHHLLAVPSGVRWDTVSVPAHLGMPLLECLLGGPRAEHIGPVLCDGRSDRTYWLIPVGSFAGCKAVRPDVHLLSPGELLAVPSPGVDHPSDLLSDLLAEHPSDHREDKASEAVAWAHWPAVNGVLTPPEEFISSLTSPRHARMASRCVTSSPGILGPRLRRVPTSRQNRPVHQRRRSR